MVGLNRSVTSGWQTPWGEAGEQASPRSQGHRGPRGLTTQAALLAQHVLGPPLPCSEEGTAAWLGRLNGPRNQTAAAARPEPLGHREPTTAWASGGPQGHTRPPAPTAEASSPGERAGEAVDAHARRGFPSGSSALCVLAPCTWPGEATGPDSSNGKRVESNSETDAARSAHHTHDKSQTATSGVTPKGALLAQGALTTDVEEDKTEESLPASTVLWQPSPASFRSRTSFRLR